MNRHTNSPRGYATFITFRFPLFGIFFISLSAEDCATAAGKREKRQEKHVRLQSSRASQKFLCSGTKHSTRNWSLFSPLEAETSLDPQNDSGRYDAHFIEEELRYIRLDDLSKVVGPAGADLRHRSTA